MLDALDAATDAFAGRLALVGDDDWSRPTPCDGWDVRYLVAHVVGGNRFAELVLSGVAGAEAMADVLSSSHPGNRFAASAAAQRAGFVSAGEVVDHVIGPMPTERFLELRVFDVTMHAWDLATAIGADAAIDGELAETVLPIASREHGAFGIEPLGRTGADATVEDRLLDVTGRRA